MTYLTSNQFAIVRPIGYNWGMGKKRTPEQREAMKFAYWNKWGGGDPNKVLRSKEIDYEDPWYVREITSPELDETLRK